MGKIVSAKIMGASNGEIGGMIVIEVIGPKKYRGRSCIHMLRISAVPETWERAAHDLKLIGLTIPQMMSGNWEKLLAGRRLRFNYIATEEKEGEDKLEAVEILPMK